MAIGDITVFQTTEMGAGALTYNVASGATVINPGEPVTPSVGGQTGITSTAVIAAVTSSPIVSTSSALIAYVGIAATTSTQTTTVNGSVSVIPTSTSIVYLIAPKVLATWNTQTKYNDLVGSRVTIDLTGGVYTINSTDGFTNGCVVVPLDISKYPGKVAFRFRGGASYLS